MRRAFGLGCFWSSFWIQKRSTGIGGGASDDVVSLGVCSTSLISVMVVGVGVVVLLSKLEEEEEEFSVFCRFVMCVFVCLVRKQFQSQSLTQLFPTTESAMYKGDQVLDETESKAKRIYRCVSRIGTCT